MLIRLYKWNLRLLLLVSSSLFYGMGSERAISNDELELLDLNLEDLLNVEVTSVSKKPQKYFTSPAAIYVVSAEEIRRSGATTIPDLLRRVPGLHVGRIDANKWSVSSRGFPGRFANKLLVLLDGRSVYDPSFAGVYWETEEIILQDIERIEVIRGPGSTLWGANAVNGVINIISKKAKDSLGFYGLAGVGSHQNNLIGIRFGSELSRTISGRVYAKQNGAKESRYPDGDDAGDDYRITQSGFLLDWDGGDHDKISLSADIYDAEINQKVEMPGSFSQILNIKDEVLSEGWHVKGLWRRDLNLASGFTTKFFYRDSNRSEALYDNALEEFDLEWQHDFVFGIHNIIWGSEYRKVQDNFKRFSFAGDINPQKRSYRITSLFFQDEIRLVDEKLRFGLGAKIEDKDIADREVMPNFRMIWLPDDKHVWWAGISASARTASRVEIDDSNIVVGALDSEDPRLPDGLNSVAISAQGKSSFKSEKLIALEAGYRFLSNSDWSLDMAVFNNQYRDLRTAELSDVELIESSFIIPLIFQNKVDGRSLGSEIILEWYGLSATHVKASYSFIAIKIDEKATSDVTASQPEKSSPRHQGFLQIGYKLGDRAQLNAWLQYVDEIEPIGLSAIKVPRYLAANFNLIYNHNQHIAVSMLVENMFDPGRIEYAQESFTNPTEVERRLLLKLEVKF